LRKLSRVTSPSSRRSSRLGTLPAPWAGAIEVTVANGTLHFGGGLSFKSRGKTVTLSHMSISRHGTVTDNRTDVLHARVNGIEVELATAVQSTPDEDATGSGPSESDLENPVTLTAALAQALGRGFQAG
jgi:hypothetical protein